MSIAAKQLDDREGKVPFVPMDLDAERRVLGI